MSTPVPTPPVFQPVELPSKYSKAIVAIITAVLTVLVTAMADNKVDAVDVANTVVAFLFAFLVYAVPNFNQNTGAYLKVIIAFIGAGVQAAVPFLVDGNAPTPAQWIVVALSAIGALGVGIVPNANPVIVAETKEDGTQVVTSVPDAPKHLAS